MTNILVLGGTGKTGRRVVARLRAAGHDARAAARSGQTRFDWDDASTWDSALAGAEGVYVVIPEMRHDVGQVVPSFIKHAAAAGPRRMVLLSARGVETMPDGPYLAIENAARDSGLEWTVLRPTWFAQNFDEGIFHGLIMAGELALPAGDGLEPFVDAEDIADVAVAALTEDGHAGQVYELSGPDLMSFRSAIDVIAAASGRTVAYVDLTEGEFVQRATAQGMPAEFAAIMAGLFGRIRDGHEARLSDGVRRALGREPRSFADYARAAADSGAWTG